MTTNNNNTIQYGLFETKSLLASLQTLPTAGAKKLSSAPNDNLWSSSFISSAFREFDFNTVVIPEDAKFDASSNDALGQALGTALDIQNLSMKNCAGRSQLSVPHVLSTTLQISYSLKLIDITNCGIDANSAKNTLAKAIPGNRTVTDWIFAENPIGDDGCVCLNEALVRSAAQRVSYRKCKIENIVRACEGLLKVPSIFAFDLSENPSYDSDPATRDFLVSKQDLLAKNAHISYPRSKCLLVAFGVTPATAGGDSEHGAGVGENNAENQQEGENAQNGEENGDQQNEEPSLARSKNTNNNSSGRFGSTANEFDRNLRQWKRKAATPVATGGTARSNSQQQQRENSPSMARTGSARNYDSRQAPIKRDAQSKDLLHGVQEWKEIRNQYNQYISHGANSPARSQGEAQKSFSEMRNRALAKPTFVLGKRVDQVTRNTSPAFRGNPTTFRTATPKDIQKHAPWLNQAKPSPGSHNQPANYIPPAVGTRTTVQIGEDSRGKPIYTTIEDGGETTYLNNDPREIGYYAKKVKAHEITPKEPWRKSNTVREVRFGISERQNGRGMILKEQQAPDPGAYEVEDEWVKRARKLKEQAKLREGRKMFGSSGAPRSSVGPAPTHEVGNPGPGYYEIP